MCTSAQCLPSTPRALCLAIHAVSPSAGFPSRHMREGLRVQLLRLGGLLRPVRVGEGNALWAMGPAPAGHLQPLRACAIGREEPPIGFRNQKQRIRRVPGVCHVRKSNVLSKHCCALYVHTHKFALARTCIASSALCIHMHIHTPSRTSTVSELIQQQPSTQR